MTVWIVTKGWCPNTEPSTLENWDGFQDIVGVYDSAEKAYKVSEDLFDPYNPNQDICVTEIDVQ